MSDTPGTGSLEFRHVSKIYHIGTLGTLRGTLAALWDRRSTRDAATTLWALRDVSFRVAPGQSLGLIGPNGAGKTTTLKLLSNITRPASGQIVVSGRVSSLIELGAGFHPELTGRENIYLNGAILGLKRREIARKLNDIIAFSELGQFIDTPVKRYSSGMYVRLGFAVAVHVEPDVLLVDEVLAVGDATFRQRCVQRMRELQRAGTTVLFVSHNMHMVRDMCDSALLLMHGEVRAIGDPAAVISEYEKLLAEGNAPSADSGWNGQPRFDSQGEVIIKEVEILSSDGSPAGNLDGSLPAAVRVSYRAIVPQEIGRVVVWIVRDDGTLCSTADSSHMTACRLAQYELRNEGSIEVMYRPLQLTSGYYNAEVRITDVSNSIVIASGQSRRFQVHGTGHNREWGVYLPNVSWRATAGDS